ncbi:MAG TPA: CRTAC1 family protein, partial [Thermoanaerobaculia bacterium]|nr:CRTAC1 family protein [Thermoanaerobaculia bacterium]
EGDGYLDVVTASFYGSLRYYRNLAGKGFADVTEEVGLGGVEQPLSVSAADFNNDGAMDLLVVRPFDHFQLFANDGKGHFKDVTAASGLLDSKPAGTIAASWFAAWGDVDNDGRLDLFLSSWAFRIPFAKGLVAKPRLDSKLYINEGNGHFRDATAEYGLAGVVEDRQFIGAAFGDYDGDGWPDLFIAGPIPGTSALLHNEQGRRFVKVPGLDLREGGFTAAFLDVNQDGRLDVFQAGFNDARTATERTVFGAKGFTMGPSLFLLQQAAGGFDKRPDLFAGGTGAGTMGVGYGDLDNDGCFDFYLGSGDPEPWFILPHRMYHGEERDGECTGRMEDISVLNGFGNVQKGHAIVFFDFDNDGRQDVLSVLGGMWPADAWTSQLFVNESELHNHWIKVRLRGRRTNSFGVGARLKITARRPDGRLIVRYRQMDNGTGFGSSPYLAHVGLMDAVAVSGVEVYWPASHCRRSYPAALDRLTVLDEADCLAGSSPALAAGAPAAVAASGGRPAAGGTRSQGGRGGRP